MAAPRQFVVGDKKAGADFSTAEIEAMVHKIHLWFKSPECNRKTKDPLADAKKAVTDCLLAQNAQGDPWINCPSELTKRIKIKTAYDTVADRGIYTAKMHQTGINRRVLRGDAEKAARTAMKDLNAGTYKFDADEFRAKVESDILVSFPELDNPAHRPNVRSLSGYYAQRETIDRELAAGVSASKREQLLKSLKLIEEMGDGTMRRLGVHPDQVRKKISDKSASTIADLVALLSEDQEYTKREKIWSLQLALQLWWMSEHANGNKSGPQLHDFEIWHLTRSRPIKHTCRCGSSTVLVEGFEPTELRDYLIANGVLVEEAVLPSIQPKDLVGLATADLTLPPTLPEVP